MFAYATIILAPKSQEPPPAPTQEIDAMYTLYSLLDRLGPSAISQLADQMQFINFMKNIAIAGGFLLLAARGAGAWSVDAWRAKRVGNALASAQGAA